MEIAESSSAIKAVRGEFRRQMKVDWSLINWAPTSARSALGRVDQLRQNPVKLPIEGASLNRLAHQAIIPGIVLQGAALGALTP